MKEEERLVTELHIDRLSW